jgi:hypothetical protein
VVDILIGFVEMVPGTHHLFTYWKLRHLLLS